MGRTAKQPLSYHRGKKQYYKLVHNKFVYFGPHGPEGEATFNAAYAEYLDWKRDADNPVKSIHAHQGKVPGLVFQWDGDLEPTPQNAAILLALGALRAMRSETSAHQRDAIYDTTLAQLRQMMDNKRDFARPVPPKGTGLRLSEYLLWWKQERKPTQQYYRDNKNRYQQLIDCVGDIHLNQMTPDHIRQFLRQLVKDGKTGNNRAAIVGGVKLILNFALKPAALRAEGYDRVKQSLPADLRTITAMLNVDADERTEPPVDCQLPFPAKEFKTITTRATKQGDKRFLAVWLLSCNCGLNLTDIPRLVWGQSVNLDDTIPHLNLSRLKRGKGERHIPMHQKTVKALREYRQTLPTDRNQDGQPVFWGLGVYHHLPATGRSIRDEFQDHRKHAKVNPKWQYKHLRNVGPNVRVQSGLSVDMGWAFMGHTQRLGELHRYEYREPGRLMPLVASIGQMYF